MNIKNEFKVTVLLLSYNHKPYIKKAIESILSQKTNFKFKIIIHDDCSTDGSNEIIRVYCKKYPDIIVPILQNENKYSKNEKIILKYMLPKVSTKYIAFLESDDFWIDDYKLQKQYDYMESNPDCSICVHNSIFYEYDKNESKIRNKENYEKDFTIDEIILGTAALFTTNTIFVRSKFFKMLNEDFYGPVGDYTFLVWFALYGRVHYFPDVMSQYNHFIPSSWSSRIERSSEKTIVFYKNLISWLKYVDNYTNYKHHKVIRKRIYLFEYEISKLKYNKINIFFPKYLALNLSRIKNKIIRICHHLIHTNI